MRPPLTTDEINALILQGRSLMLDWLPDNALLDDMALLLASLANTHGGMLLIGLESDEAIRGVRSAPSTIDNVLEAALMLDPPLMIPMPQPLELGRRQIVIVHVPAGMPNVYGLRGLYLRREGITTLGLTPQELRRLMIERGITSFEAEVATNADQSDMDWEKARAYTRLLNIRDRDVHKTLERRGCLVRFHDELRPTNAGILLFGKDPQRHLRGAEITAARFAGQTLSDTFSREDITGTLPDQIRRAETFLADHLRKGVRLGKTMERDEQPEYPMEAARELVVNAVAHRDYSITGDTIRLFIFQNQLEVTSPGRLPGPVTIDNIKDERFSRNPIIVQVLADMGFIERLGYGVDRVIDLMRAQNLRAPEFNETAGGFRVTLFNTPLVAVSRRQAAPEKDDGLTLNPRQEIALGYLHNPDNTRITNSDLQNLCPEVHPETIRRDLADLVARNILVKRGKKRGSYYMLPDANGLEPNDPSE